MADIEEMESMGDDEFEEAQATLDDQVENAVEIPETFAEPAEAPEPEPEPEQEEEPVDSEETDDTPETEEVDEPEHDDTQIDEPSEEEVEVESQQDTGSETVDFDYKASYEAIMAPIKASGKEVTIKSVQDLRDLANMGIDYSRKMRDIKPLRAVGETLAKAGIIVDGNVDEAALTRLLDISNGNKDALASLLKEQNIDPMEMELDEVEYTPESTMVSQEAIALQDVEKELVSRGSVNSVVTALDKLDDRSKQFFNETPANLLKLEDDISSGAYEQIMGAVEYERSLGRLGELSDMEAYMQFAKLSSQEAPAAPSAPRAKAPSAAKRKAAGISKRPPVNNKQKVYDYMAMSDEDFEKLTPDTGMY